MNHIMSPSVVFVKVSVNIYSIFKFFQAFKPSSLLLLPYPYQSYVIILSILSTVMVLIELGTNHLMISATIASAPMKRKRSFCWRTTPLTLRDMFAEYDLGKSGASRRVGWRSSERVCKNGSPRHIQSTKREDVFRFLSHLPISPSPHLPISPSSHLPLSLRRHHYLT